MESSKQAVVSPRLVTFGPTGSLIRQTTLTGKKDMRAEKEETLRVAVKCESDDRQFNTANAETTAALSDVQFPSFKSMYPLTSSYVGTLVTLEASGLGSTSVVHVGGVNVNQPPSLRTVLLNETSGMLEEVNIINEPVIQAWEIDADNLHAHQGRAEGLSMLRRAKGGKGGMQATSLSSERSEGGAGAAVGRFSYCLYA